MGKDNCIVEENHISLVWKGRRHSKVISVKQKTRLSSNLWNEAKGRCLPWVLILLPYSCRCSVAYCAVAYFSKSLLVSVNWKHFVPWFSQAHCLHLLVQFCVFYQEWLCYHEGPCSSTSFLNSSSCNSKTSFLPYWHLHELLLLVHIQYFARPCLDALWELFTFTQRWQSHHTALCDTVGNLDGLFMVETPNIVVTSLGARKRDLSIQK